DYNDTMTLVEELIRAIAHAVNGALEITLGDTTLDLDRPFRRITMFEAIANATGKDLSEVWERADDAELRKVATELDVHVGKDLGAGYVLMDIFETHAERTLIEPTFVTGMPKDVSPLAKAHRSIRDFTEHADLIINGVEQAPVYSELNDPDEQ